MTRFNEAASAVECSCRESRQPAHFGYGIDCENSGRSPGPPSLAMNSSFQGEEIHLYRDINIGVAVALETGLIVPVVHDVGSKGVSEIAGEVKDLSLRARNGQLVPAEVRGGTFTISNLGPFGVEQFNAIINPPEAAILAVGATQNEVVASEDGQVVVTADDACHLVGRSPRGRWRCRCPLYRRS